MDGRFWRYKQYASTIREFLVNIEHKENIYCTQQILR